MGIFSIIAVAAGVIAVFRDVAIVRSGRSRPANVAWERFGLAAAVVCVLFAVLMIWNAIEKSNSSILWFAAVQLVFAVGAILVFLTRWRQLTEGLGAIALGILSFLTGFSIGIFFLPFAVALGVGASNHTNPRLFESPGVKPGVR